MTPTKKSILHAVAAVVLFSIPVILASHSPILDLTVGGILNLGYQFFYHYYNS